MTNVLVAEQLPGATVLLPTASPGTGPGAGAVERRLRRLDRVHRVLETARMLIERGWLQSGWCLTAPAPPPRSLFARLVPAARTPSVDEVRSACLVAAVAIAADGGGSRPDVVVDAGPALDIIWDTLQADSGHPGPDVTGRVASPAVRVARMRDLVRWNDAAGRSRQDVLGLLDRAISRTILTAASTAARPAG